jgi:hypothetical protein
MNTESDITRAARTLERRLRQLQPADLTDAERAALRTLFRELVALSRARGGSIGEPCEPPE